MGVPMVKRCCCCATLHTGTLIIGYVYTVWSLIELTVYSLLVTLAPLGKDGTVSTHKFVLYITAAVVSGTHLLCSVLLVVAAYKMEHILMVHLKVITITSKKPFSLPHPAERRRLEFELLSSPEDAAALPAEGLMLYTDGSKLEGKVGAAVSCWLGGVEKLASLTLPWTIVTGILTAVMFVMTLTGISLVIQDSGEMLEVEVAIISAHLLRACVSVYCIVVVHSRHKQLMYEDDEARFQHSARLYKAVKTRSAEADHAL